MLDLILLFARGGGGGSSSGGGAGGGLIMVGYLPMHFIGAQLRKRLNPLPANLVAWPTALVFSIGLVGVLRGIGFIIAIGAFIGTGAGLYGWFHKIAKLRKKAKLNLQKAAATDANWDEAKLLARVREVFLQYQYDWSMNDISKATYMTPWYHFHASLMIAALKLQKRQNFVYEPKITDVQIVQVDDAAGTESDAFEAVITATANDQLYDMSDNSLLFQDNREFMEFWRFERHGDTWNLARIRQATENPTALDIQLEAFARENQFCFSPDWGWLLLPKRGQLFDKAKFGTSDINNHVIGTYHNMLVQLYNYIPVKNNNTGVNYIIAQVALPKSYGNIVVRKKRTLGFGISGLTKVSMEWKDFNSRYEVWASDMERVTSFELLHPAYMVKLQELPFEVNIEVVDNIVYLYSAKVPSTVENYQIMLGILQEAFKQMRM